MNNNLNKNNRNIFNNLALLTELKSSKIKTIEDEIKVNREIKNNLSKDRFLSLNRLFKSDSDIIAN